MRLPTWRFVMILAAAAARNWAADGVAPAESASSPGPERVWNYALLPGSTLTEECPLCAMPIVSHPMSGTFQVRLVEENPLFARYEVQAIAFAAGYAGGRAYQVTGQGSFTIGGEVAWLQEMWLEGRINNGVSNTLCHLVNRSLTVERPWPLLQIALDQTNGTDTQVYHLALVAAPMRELWFSTAHGFHAGIWNDPTNYVSPGDLLSSAGRVVKRNQALSARLGIMPSVPDLGLDAAGVLPGGEIAFSIETDIYSETLEQMLHDGDVLSNRGRVVHSFADLLGAFVPEPPAPDPGLDALQVASATEVYFSVKTDFFSERLGRLVRRGDLLSSRGEVIRTNGELVAAFHPFDPKPDYGLDAIWFWPDGEIWFSVENGFVGSHFDMYMPGDLLSDRGYVVYRNLDLLNVFQPLEDLADFGLDSLCILSDATAPPAPAPVTAFAMDSLSGCLRFEGPAGEGLYQLERAAVVLGPWIPLGPITQETQFRDCDISSNHPQAFYRLRQW